MIKRARELNDGMLEYYFKKIEKLGGKKVGIVGLSYREGVKEKAYSRSVPLIALLRKKGYEVFGADGLYSENEIGELFGIKPIGKFEDMDAIVIMNRETKFRAKLRKLKSKIIDIKNILE